MCPRAHSEEQGCGRDAGAGPSLGRLCHSEQPERGWQSLSPSLRRERGREPARGEAVPGAKTSR